MLPDSEPAPRVNLDPAAVVRVLPADAPPAVVRVSPADALPASRVLLGDAPRLDAVPLCRLDIAGAACPAAGLGLTVSPDGNL